MSKQKTVVAFASGAVCAGALAFAIAAGPEDKQTGMPEMSPEMAAEMQGWIELGTPNKNHEMLARAVGEWDARTWFKMDPDAPAMEGTGTMKTEAVMGGRYLVSDYHMDDMMGEPFDGKAIMGYDNGRGEFVSVWIDSWSTALFNQSGQMSSDGSKLILMGSAIGPDGEETMKMVSEFVDENTMVDTMYDLVDGEWNMHGKITYTRKGHADAGG